MSVPNRPGNAKAKGGEQRYILLVVVLVLAVLSFFGGYSATCVHLAMAVASSHIADRLSLCFASDGQKMVSAIGMSEDSRTPLFLGFCAAAVTAYRGSTERGREGSRFVRVVRRSISAFNSAPARMTYAVR